MFHATTRLDGERAFITGASAGIGAACARALVRGGASVHLGARRQDALAQTVATLLAETPNARVTTAPLDVTDPTSRAEFLARGEDAAGPCSILVQNAGLARGADPVEKASLDDWDEMLDTNVRALFALTRAVLPGMLARGRGDILMMASVAGRQPYANGAVYCATKAAVQAFSKSVRQEVLGRGVRILTLDPGMVETDFSRVRFRGDEARARQVYAGLTPLSADDIADCALFALTRPRHVHIDDMLIMASAQASPTLVHRVLTEPQKP